MTVFTFAGLLCVAENPSDELIFSTGLIGVIGRPSIDITGSTLSRQRVEGEAGGERISKRLEEGICLEALVADMRIFFRIHIKNQFFMGKPMSKSDIKKAPLLSRIALGSGALNLS